MGESISKARKLGVNRDLFAAAKTGNLEKVQMSLELGAVADWRHTADEAEQHRTALMVAADGGHTAVVRLLMAHGFDHRLTDVTNSSALLLACVGGHRECVDALLAAGAPVDTRDDRGRTPLMRAAFAGHVRVVHSLVEAGASLTAVTPDGSTPLHYAAKHDNVAVVKELLDHGADPAVKDSSGNTGGDIASARGFDDARELLTGIVVPESVCYVQRLDRLSGRLAAGGAGVSPAATPRTGDAGDGSLPDSMLIPPTELKNPRKIGSGAYGAVFVASYNHADVAVKEVRAGSLDFDSVKREAAILCSLKPHPNVVRLLGVSPDADGSALRLVLAYCPNGSVRSMLARQRAAGEYVPVSRLHSIALQAAAGLLHLHTCRVIHKDVRSDNVLVASVLNPFLVCVTDFGLSVSTVKLASQAESTSGPVAWVPPEVFVGTSSDTFARACKYDVWMFGSMMFELLFGVRPYHWLRAKDVVRHRLANRDETPLLALEAWKATSGRHEVSLLAADDDNPDVMAKLLEVMNLCWTLSPDRRPTAEVVVRELEAAVELLGSK